MMSIVCGTLIADAQIICQVQDRCLKILMKHIKVFSGSEMTSKFKLKVQLLSKQSKLLNHSAADFIKTFDLSLHSFPQHEHMQQQYCAKIQPEPLKCPFKDNSVNNVIPDPDVPDGCNSSSSEFDGPGVTSKIGCGNRDETIAGLLPSISLEGLTSQWIRPFPPRLPITDGELCWLNPDFNHELLWDYGMCADTSRGAVVRDLIAKALKGALVPVQQEAAEDSTELYVWWIVDVPILALRLYKDLTKEKDDDLHLSLLNLNGWTQLSC